MGLKLTSVRVAQARQIFVYTGRNCTTSLLSLPRTFGKGIPKRSLDCSPEGTTHGACFPLDLQRLICFPDITLDKLLGFHFAYEREDPRPPILRTLERQMLDVLIFCVSSSGQYGHKVSLSQTNLDMHKPVRTEY